MTNRYLLIFHLLICQFAFAARPTVNPSNLYISTTNCTSLTLTWSNGNGNARMVIGREANSISFVPTDGVVYSGANAAFGSGLAVGTSNDHYVLMNGVGSSSLTISNLKAGTMYYFSIFEHDNNGSNVEYLTSNAPSISITTYNTTLNFSISRLDSCESSNLVRLTNNSSSSIPGQTFTYYANNQTYNADVPIDLHLNGSGYINITINASNTKGCPSQLTKVTKIFPKEIGSFDFKNNPDTIQNYLGHLFKMTCSIKLTPFPVGVTYHWTLGDGDTSLFQKVQKKYAESDTYKIRCILNYKSYSQATPCKDTLYTHFILGPNPYQDLQWGRDTIYEDYDDYVASVNSDRATILKWYFGDGDSSSNDTTSHIYYNPGTYTVRLHIKTNFGFEGDTSRNVVVLHKQLIFQNLKLNNGPFYNNVSSTFATYNNKHVESFIWYFGDGDSSINTTEATHTYVNAGTYSIKLKVKTFSGTLIDSTKQVIIDKNPVSIEQQTYLSIKIGPNPSNNHINISNPTKANLDIAIYNSNGQLMHKGSIQETTQSIDISKFNNGVYSIVILENGTVLGSQNLSITK